jgi:hypothetical protein
VEAETAVLGERGRRPAQGRTITGQIPKRGHKGGSEAG